jgi:DNA-binding XRE family transcriptional regulator
LKTGVSNIENESNDQFGLIQSGLQQPQTSNPYILALIDIDQKQADLKNSLETVEASQKAMEARLNDLENTFTLEKAFFGPAPVLPVVTPVTAPVQEFLPLSTIAPVVPKPAKQKRPRMTKLRKLRTEKGLSGSDVASVAGISKSHYKNIETGRSDPSYKTLQGIAKALGVSTAKIASCLESRGGR